MHGQDSRVGGVSTSAQHEDTVLPVYPIYESAPVTQLSGTVLYTVRVRARHPGDLLHLLL